MVLISVGNFDFGAKIKFEYPASYLTSFKFEESLLITNVESMRGNATNYPISILLTDYFRYTNKLDSLTLIFENFVIGGLNASVIKYAPSIKTMWLEMNQKLDNEIAKNVFCSPKCDLTNHPEQRAKGRGAPLADSKPRKTFQGILQ
uniref:Uncharacterized protein n=1 Tax=Romanomermis culicivorax TaxID=13658 RepID=A0A915L716_ROMCU